MSLMMINLHIMIHSIIILSCFNNFMKSVLTHEKSSEMMNLEILLSNCEFVQHLLEDSLVTFSVNINCVMKFDHMINVITLSLSELLTVEILQVLVIIVICHELFYSLTFHVDVAVEIDSTEKKIINEFEHSSIKFMSDAFLSI